MIAARVLARRRLTRHTGVMVVEIERRFLVESPPLAVQDVLGEQMRQGYLALDGSVAVRVRITASAALLTVKAGDGLARTEVEVPLDPAEAEQLWHHTTQARIDKTRRAVPLPDGGVVDLDEYHGPLDGLWTAEVEFADEAAAHSFVPPAWFGVEVTGHREWSNAALARHGRPDRTS